MASPPPAAASDPPQHDLQPVHVKTSSPRFPPPPATPTSISSTSSTTRRIAIAVDLSDESAFAVKWAVYNYLRPGDTVILLHVRSTSVLYGADWGSSTPTTPSDNPFSATSPGRMEEEIDNFTATKANKVAQPLVDAGVPLKIHIVKDHDMKERLCLEVERLGLSAVIMGSRGTGAQRRSSKGKLGSVSDYCVQHCACPVVVVRYHQEENAATPEEEPTEFHDAVDQQK
ncbi:Universal stress protein phos34 [Castilleja foliolosa]|uniref:Universal stress protein phos34 n=1 Tax=Castilleja foliolosa TaxID=1961234 RepID=A0ABD3E232_9LAMI